MAKATLSSIVRFKPNLITKMIDIGDGVKVRVKMAASFYKKYKSMI